MAYSKEQAKKDMEAWKYDYWGCEGYECSSCPVQNSHAEEQNPRQYYGTESCRVAQVLDIITRLQGINTYVVTRGDGNYGA